MLAVWFCICKHAQLRILKFQDLKIRAVPTDHKQVKKTETWCCSVTQTSLPFETVVELVSWYVFRFFKTFLFKGCKKIWTDQFYKDDALEKKRTWSTKCWSTVVNNDYYGEATSTNKYLSGKTESTLKQYTKHKMENLEDSCCSLERSDDGFIKRWLQIYVSNRKYMLGYEKC